MRFERIEEKLDETSRVCLWSTGLSLFFYVRFVYGDEVYKSSIAMPS